MTKKASGSAPRFYFVDVFATEPLTGNPLAVVAGGEALSLELMQRISREFNQSETTFILPATRPGADWRLRSFTPTGAEVFGAGHNALGAWWWLAESGALPLAQRTEFKQEIGERVLPLKITIDSGRPTSVVMTQTSPVPGKSVIELDRLAKALGLSRTDLDYEKLPVQVVSTGAAHLLVSVKDKDTVDRIRANSEELYGVLKSVEGQGCYVFSRGARHPEATFYARFFNPTVGIWEDPATGSAAGPLACHLAAHGFIRRKDKILIEQGTSMGRTSLIRVRVTESAVEVSGSGITVAEGVLKL